MKKLLGGLLGNGLPDFDSIIVSAFAQFKLGFITYGIIGFLLAIIFLLVTNYVERFKAKSTLFKVFSYFNLVYIPVLFVLVCGSLGAWTYSRNHSISEIPEEVVPSLKISFPAFQLYLEMNHKLIDERNYDLKDMTMRFSKLISFESNSDAWIDQQKLKVAEKEIPLMLYRGIDAIVQTEIEKKGITDQKKIDVAMEMSFFKSGHTFWKDVENNLVDSTQNYFNLKLIWWFGYSLVGGSLLLLQLLLSAKYN